MSKYHNIKTRCLSRHLHDSKFEASYCNKLLAMKKRGEISDYDAQWRVDLGANITHILDFLVYRKDGLPEVHETKGVWTPVARLKKKLFEAKYPDTPYKVIYQEGREPKCQRKKMVLRKRIRIYR